MIKEKASIEERHSRRQNLIKKTPKFLIFALIFLALILTPIALNQYYNYLLWPVSSEDSPQIFIIKPGQPVTQIAQNLKKENLIKSSFAFRLLVSQMGIAQKIQAGDFRLSQNMTSRDIAKELTHGAIDVWVTIPEGLRIEEQAQKIEEKLKFGSNNKFQFDKKEYLKLADEGYMFPDTYLIPKDVSAANVVERLRQTFDQKVEKNILEKGGENNLSPEEVIVLASLVEREAKTNEERPIIAGILLNRLEAGVALQVDATVQYAKGYDSAKNSWWPQVSREDYRSVKSPYNTYLFTGLPTKPIASPGLESIRAASDPQDTDYFYYLHDPDGKIHYAKTIEEHNRNIQEFL